MDGVNKANRAQGDIDYLSLHWEEWKFALNFSLSFIDDSGMMNVTSPSDWLRFGMGGHNIEVSASHNGISWLSLSVFSPKKGQRHPIPNHLPRHRPRHSPQ